MKRGKKKKKVNMNNARRQHARGIGILQARKERGGGVGPRRNNRIPESATKESREAKRKANRVAVRVCERAIFCRSQGIPS